MTDMPPSAPPPAPLIYPSSPPKEPVLIAVCNALLVGCVGYFMIGQWQKGVAALAAWLVIGIPTCFVGAIAVCIATGIDGYMQAEALKNGFPLAQWTFFKDHR